MTDSELHHTAFGSTYQNKIEKTVDFKVGDIVLQGDQQQISHQRGRMK